MSNRKVNLVKNTAIYALGSFGSKLLQLILVPYYTRAMTTSEFGFADVLQAVVALLFPVISLSIFDAAFRFGMEESNDKNAVLSTGVAITLIGTVVLCTGGLIVNIFYPSIYLWLVIFNAIVNCFRTLYSQYTRSIGKTALFTVDNILLTAFVLILNIFFISVLKMGAAGYMLGYTLANALSSIFLILNLKKLAFVKFDLIKSTLTKPMLRYSLPLIPNALCWWFSSFGSRFFITYFLGESANGLYAAAYKIPSLLSVISSIFFQAWHISANEEFKKKDIAQFYTEIHNLIFALIVTLSSGLILMSKIITTVFLGGDYKDEWFYIPILLIAIAFLSFAQFLESIYTANKKTGMAFVTSFISVSINLILNFLLIKPLGVSGCAIALAVSYFVLWISRIFNTHKIIPIKYDLFKTISAVLILILQAVFIYFKLPFAFIFTFITLILLFVIFRKNFSELINFGLKLARKFFKKEPQL